MGCEVRFDWNKAYWGEVMTSQATRSMLMDKAESVASAADSRVGSSPRAASYRNPNFVARVETRAGTRSQYCVGLVIAANPRSIYKASRGGILG